MKRKYHILALCLILGILLFPSTKIQAANGWNEGNGAVTYLRNGTRVTGIQKIGDEVYYFDQDGILRTGRIAVSGKIYHFSTKGDVGEGYGRLELGWITEGGKKYYYSENGTVGTNIKKVTTVKGNYKKGSSPYGKSLSKAQLKIVKKAVVKFMNTEIATNMSQADKVIAAHDYVMKKTSFRTSKNYKKMKYNTAYGVFGKKKAQCEGYSRAMKALCDAMGIKCYMVKSTNVHHTWNIVRVDGKYYHVDSQIDDSFTEDNYILCMVGDAQRKIGGFRWSKKYPKCKTYFPYTMNVPGISGKIYW